MMKGFGDFIFSCALFVVCCGWCSVAMAQTADGSSAPQVRVRVFLEAPLGTMAAPPLAVRVAEVGSVLQLMSSEAEATTQVKVVIYATNTDADLTMTVSVDAAGAEVVAVPSEPIVVAATGNAMLRTAQFVLTTKRGGMATVTIAVTDGTNNVAAPLRVVVAEPTLISQHTLAVIEPQADTELPLMSGGAEATTQVQVVVDATDTAAELTLTVSVDAAGAEVVAVPNALMVIAADGNVTRRTAQFALTAKEAGMAVVTIAVTDGASTDTVALRIVVTELPRQHTLAVIEPQADTELPLMSGGAEATTQVQVVVDATDTAAELTLTVSVDAAGAEVVAVPNALMVIAADGNVTRRTAQFALTAKEAGMAVVTIAVTDGASTDTVALRIVVTELPRQHTLAVIEPQAGTELQLLSRGAETTTQVQVVVDATDTAAELTMTLFVNDVEVVAVSNTSIVIAADGNATRRTAQFALTAKEAGMAVVTIAVTDGASTATVAVRVIVADSLQILSPSDGTQIALVRGDGTLAATQVEVVIAQQHTEVPVALDLQLERIAMPSVFISTTSLSLIASADSSTRTRFTLAAAEVGNTTLTLVASDSLGNRASVSVRVSVARVGELCESCLVPEMRTVSPGTFLMGSPANESGREVNEGPQHPVRIGYAFAVGQYELTRGQYRAFVDATGYTAGSRWFNPDFTQSDVHPVVHVSWEDAKAYLSWLSEETGEEWRLLSEAEWEYAARAGTTTSYSFGNTIDATQARFNSTTGTVAVGSHAANAFGLHDMHGNVYEWVEDCWHNDYSSAPTDGSAWLSDCDEDGRVLHGGSWDEAPRGLRSAFRFRFEARDRSNYNLGFRVARTLPQPNLAVIEPQTSTELKLLSRGDEATTQVQVVINAIDIAADITMTVSVDAAGAEVVTIPNASIVIAADGNATRRTAQFALTAKRVGMATVTIAVTDGTNNVTVPLRIVVAEPMPQHTLAVIEPQTDTELQLLSRGVEAMAQVQVVIDATDTAAELTMTLFVNNAEVVAVPNASIAIAADGNATRRSTEFALTAKRTGMAVVTIAVTDGASTDTVALRVIVADSLQILSPSDGIQIALVRGDGSLAATQVEVVIVQQYTEVPVTLDLQLERTARSPVFISTTSLSLIASADSSTRTRFTLAAAEAGNTTITLVASDSLENRSSVSVRVSVVRVGELCESCLVPDMHTVLPGTFTMGSPASESGRNANEGPQHQVRISYTFAVGQYELTRGQYRVFVDATGYDAGSGWLDPGFTQSDAHPVVRVSWDDAKAYLSWLSEETGEEWRLLSEAEWEYAARAGTRTRYSFGDTIDATQARFDSSTGTVAVGSYAANAFGLHDMHGNVWEWVEDCWHVNYNDAPTDGSAWLSECNPGDAFRLLRGGSWIFDPRDLRSADRGRLERTRNRNNDFGFRVARTLPQPNLAVIEPQANTELQLLNRGIEATTQVQVVINATDTAAELTLTVSVDDAGAEVVSIPNAPIVIAAASNATQRSAEFELTAKTNGTATVRIVVTDGASTATVVLRVVVADSLQILSPSDGTQIALVRGDGSLAATQVEVVIVQQHTEVPVELDLQLERIAMPPVFISTTSLSLIASADGSTRTRFTLATAEAGNTTLTLIASDSLGNRAVVSVRVSVVRLDELCESCLVPDMRTVPAGTFTMGSPPNEPNREANEEPQHQVRISYPFAVGQYELTRGQYRAFVDASGYAAGSAWLNPGFTQNDAHPVVHVSWEDANAYLSWLSKETGEEWRLLSEAEWEYAARAGTTTSYSFGDTINAMQARFNSTTGTVAVGSYAANAFGLHDMHGNVWEWVEDCWHNDYNQAPTDGSAWLNECTETRRVLRVGAWYDPPRYLRSAYRSWANTWVRIDGFGFRVARTLPSPNLAVIEPQANTELQLLSRGIEATTQVQVVIDATDTAAELTLTVSVDAAGAEVVTIPNAPIVIAADGNATQRSTEFALTAKRTGMAVVTIAVTDGTNNVTASLRVVVAEPMPQHTLAVIEPQTSTELQLLSRGVEATARVQVVIDATDIAAELTLTVLVDAAGAEVVSVPNAPIVIAADGNAMRRTAQFTLTAKEAGMAVVTIAVTDGTSTATVALRVVVVDPTLEILSPYDGTQIALVRGDGSLAATQVEVVIVQTNVEVPVALDLRLDHVAMPPVFISTTSLTLTAPADGSTRTRFTLAAVEVGNTTLTLVASDSLGNRSAVSVRVSVTRLGELCETCLVPDMLTVPAGTFTMGSPTGEPGRQANEGPLHPVRISYAFAVGQYELTRGQYRAFVDASGYAAGNDDWIDPDITQNDAHPVVYVSWEDANAYLSWLSEETGEEWRLLSEAEWEYAARSGMSTSYAFGDTIDAQQANYWPSTGTVAVGSYAANEFGLHDMHGNVWEWVEDCWHHDYTNAPVDGSAWLSECNENARVQRGGSWNNFPVRLRSAYRSRGFTSNRNSILGFRVARTLPQPLLVIEPQAGSILLLMSSEAEATTQVQVVIDAADTAAEITMTVSVDAAGVEVVTIPNAPIAIAADGNAMRRTAQFALTAKTTGTATVTITVTDGARTDTVALRVAVADSFQILSPPDGTQIALVRGDGSLAANQVEVVIVQTNVEVPVALDLRLDRVAMPPVFISTSSLSLIASADGIIRTQFTLAAVEVGNTTLTLVASDSLGNRSAVSVRVSVTRISELCESCLVPDMLTVPAGTFTMGSPTAESGRQSNEGPLHPVRIGSAFAVGQYELTRGQYRAFVDASGYAAGNNDWIDPDITQNDAHPVVYVSWEDANAYLSWLSEETGEEWRLLSEAEWEYAARSGMSTSYAFGDTIDAQQANYWPSTGTVAVGSYAANEFGLHDMHGNVWEWVEDCWHHDYTDAPVDGSAWLSECDENARVQRGGSWNNFPVRLRSAYRSRGFTSNRNSILGFRVARTLPQPLLVIEPQAGSILLLMSSEAEATTQVQVVIDAADTAAELTMTVSVDDAGAEVVTIPNAPIAIAADGNATRRTAQFALTAKTTGTATVTITVTDGARTDTVALRVAVADSFQILSPPDGTQIALVRGDGSLAANQVEVVIVQTNVEVPVALDLRLDRVAMPPVFISTSSLSLIASADGIIRTRFTLAAVEVGNTTLTLIASDSLGNRSSVSVRVSVTRISELCESCLVPDMLTVPAGTFTMGSPTDELGRQANEGPLHPVRISYAFAVGQYELTRGQYRAFVDASGYAAGNNDWIDPDITQNDAHPVVYVSWEDANAYLSWLSKETGEEWRLLSEAEWEYAARSGMSTSYAFGDMIDAQQANYWPSTGTVAVGSYAANEFGLHDMHGNVWEWVEDCWHHDYTDAPVDGSAWLSECDENARVQRGGSWNNFPVRLRSAYRSRGFTSNRNSILGFRVARTLPQPLLVIEPQAGSILLLMSSEAEATTQVQVVIDAADTAAELTMTVSVDAAGVEVVAIPNAPIAIAADGNAMRRTAQFALTAKTTGTATVTITVTDGVRTDTVALRVAVADSFQILSPPDGTQIALVRGDGSLAANQVEVVIVQTNVEVPVALDLRLDRVAMPPVFISTSSLSLIASADGIIRTQFTLAAVEVGNTTLTLVASDSLGNRSAVSVRVSVTRISELCESCLVPDMLTVPAGTFTMGSPTAESGRQSNEGPLHPVRIGSAFAVGQYELTRGQYRAFVDASGYAAGNNDWIDPDITQNDAHPVVYVSWEDANAYLSWLSEETGEEWRLLSEAEWEYAARSGMSTSYAFGDTIDAQQANYWPSTGTVAVGSYAANEFGLHDMHGNVWEWVEDCWHHDYTDAPVDGSAWLSECDENARVQRGGSWNNFPVRLRSAYRSRGFTSNRNSILGFRVARTLPQPLLVIEPQAGSILLLMSSEAEATTQVQVVIDAADTAAELTMTVSVDDAGAEVVTIPNAPIAIAADGNATRRTAQFALTAKTTGTATVTITVTDGARTDTVALRVAVADSFQILSPPDGTQIALVRGDGSLAANQVEVVIVQTNVEVPVALDLRLDRVAMPPVFISTSSLSLIASADGIIRTRFTLAAVEVGNTTLTLIASDSLGNRSSVSVRVSVTRISELCESCLVPDMLTVPAGTFTMGSPTDELGRQANEGPLHPVRIGSAFAVGQYELTRGQYRAFVDASGYAAGNNDWIDPDITQNDAHPVVYVSWEDANAYLSWLSRQTGEEWRLLSEAEWEYAARSGVNTSYSFGDTIDAQQANYWPSTGTVAVGSYAANEFGLHDMHGNVWEWVEDCWHHDYTNAPVDGSAWLSECDENARVQRGGSWNNFPVRLRSAYRSRGFTSNRNSILGFRVARTLPQPLLVIEPQAGSILLLMSSEAEATTQVQVVIDAADTAAEITMTVSVDAAGVEVVTIPNAPIAIAADGNAMRRTAQFALTAKTTGTATVTITVTDGARTDTVALRVAVADSFQILSPPDGTQIALVRGDGSLAANQVEVVIVQTNVEVPVALDLRLDRVAMPPVFISTSSLSLIASADGIIRTQFTLAAVEVGNTTLTLIASDSLGNRSAVSVRVSVTRISELCETCLVPDMLTVPAGTFTMGSPTGEPGRQSNEGPLHPVRIGSAFAVGQYELTRGQYRAFVDASGYAAGNNDWIDPDITQNDAHPVVYVSWEDANAYLSWLSKETGEEWRLLSEAEWEYAARSGMSTSYAFGDTIDAQQANYWPSTGTVAVGSYAANEFGLHDMHGNVWEWVEDCWHHDYTNAPVDGSAWLSECDENARVQRGGSWNNFPVRLRSAYRSRGFTSNRNSILGFRVARTLPQPLLVIEPQAGSILLLMSSEAEATTQVQVVIDAADIAADLTMTVSVDAAGVEVVTIPNAPIAIAADGNAMRRTAQFALTAKTTGTATVTITVTDGARTDTVALRVAVADSFQILSPPDGTQIALVRGDGSLAANQVEVVIVQTNVEVPVALDLRLDRVAMPPVFISTSSLSLIASADGIIRTQFTLAAVEVGNTTLTLIASDSLGNRSAVSVRVSVTRISELCETCLVPDMLTVPAGTFTMGSPTGEPGRQSNEGPLHPVRIGSAFAVGQYELTRGQYRAFVDASGYAAGNNDWIDPDITQNDAHPVVYVSWEDANAYLSWLSRQTGEEWRLLSEAEWEYAARSGVNTSYSFGDTIDAQQANYWPSTGTVAVGSYAANEFGLHDMHGNVWEWVEDCWHHDYTNAPVDGSAWLSECDENARVQRGGSWNNFPVRLRSAYRSRGFTSNRNSILGFRVARTL